LNINNYYDVVIVGAGPCGVTSANLLGKYGLSVLVIEKEADILPIPRAIGICEEGSRVIQATGVLEQLTDSFHPIDKVHFVNKQQESACHLNLEKNRNGYPELSTFFQPQLEEKVREGLQRFSKVDMISCAELIDFSDSGHQVVITLRHDNKLIQTRCRYLLGCDGARSDIRKRLDIDFTGSTYPEDWMILDVKNNPVPSNDVVFSIDPDRPSVSLPGPDGIRRWEFLVKKDENIDELFSKQNLKKLLENWGDIDDMELHRQAIYTFHARIAKQFRRGNVFLLGDAAHITPPFAGQGMMAGLRDAHNLCWKIAAVVQGQVSQKILDSYEIERHPQCKQIIDIAQRMGNMILPQSKLVAGFRDTVIKLTAYLGIHSADKGLPFSKVANNINGSMIGNFLISKFKKVGFEFPQFLIKNQQGEKKLFDDATKGNFLVLSWGTNLKNILDNKTINRWRKVGGSLASFNLDSVSGQEQDDLSLTDENNHYRDFFFKGKRVVVIRPDKMVVINCKRSQLNQRLNQYLDQISLA